MALWCLTQYDQRVRNPLDPSEIEWSLMNKCLFRVLICVELLAQRVRVVG
jgi:hypothetical protein